MHALKAVDIDVKHLLVFFFRMYILGPRTNPKWRFLMAKKKAKKKAAKKK